MGVTVKGEREARRGADKTLESVSCRYGKGGIDGLAWRTKGAEKERRRSDCKGRNTQIPRLQLHNFQSSNQLSLSFL